MKLFHSDLVALENTSQWGQTDELNVVLEDDALFSKSKFTKPSSCTQDLEEISF